MVYSPPEGRRDKEDRWMSITEVDYLIHVITSAYKGPGKVELQHFLSSNVYYIVSNTSSPFPTPVLNEEDAELQAFLAAAKREAQEKWEKLRATKTSGVEEKVGGDGGETIEAKGNVEEDVVEVEKEIVPKIEARPRKVVTRMVAGLPRNRKVIPVSLLLSIPEVH
ncbi:hypothetical protein GGU10DRAFT_337633 [Lentinula aff. detonsa]|uniref:Uncharacterized protein n=1 Tax=Lentinula aff. detonsa TaxID=2804958 RepID=A0AA38NB14_9AGAR|nr:hypothetical protein GGU10DRAFT_337633 [Lentinula aff. detonsa]